MKTQSYPSSSPSLISLPHLLAATILIAQTGVAMPKYNAGGVHINRLQSFAIAEDPILNGSQILGDDKKNVLYVSPSSKKAQTGVFYSVATPACDVLQDDYAMTYLMPPVSPNEFVTFAQEGPFSPFFDAKLGNYVRYSYLLNQILKSAAQIKQIKTEHSDLVGAYEMAKAEFEQAQSEFNSAEAAYLELGKRIRSLNEQLVNSDDEEERERIKSALLEAKKTKEEEGAERKERLREARIALYSIRLNYVNVREQYMSKVPSTEALNSEISSLASIFDTINNLSVSSLKANERALQALESATVGIASASYSIWGDEEARLQKAVSIYSNRYSFFNNYFVTRLPIHNITLKKPVGGFNQARISGDFNGDITMRTAHVGATDGSLNLGNTSKSSEHPIFTKNGNSVVPAVRTMADDGAGTYENLVTRGTLCTGSSARKSWLVNVMIKAPNLEIESSFQVFRYSPRTSNVLAQSIALEYDFFTRTEPTTVNCTLDVAKFRSFVSQSGTSGFLFWRKHWSNTERQRIDDSGIQCKVEMSPSAENPDYDDQKKYVDEIQQAMIQEIGAEYILTYAKSWDISEHAPAIPNPGRAASKAGVALMTLCGTNVYCAVGGIILQSANELFGANSGKVSNRDYLTGEIRRSYEETSWTVSKGQAVIDLTVDL